jgi:hypothetical protein
MSAIFLAEAFDLRELALKNPSELLVLLKNNYLDYLYRL